MHKEKISLPILTGDICICMSSSNATYFSICKEAYTKLVSQHQTGTSFEVYVFNTVSCIYSKSSNYEDRLKLLAKSGCHSVEEKPSIITPQRE